MQPVVLDEESPSRAWARAIKYLSTQVSVPVVARGLRTAEIEGPATILVRRPELGFVGNSNRVFSHAVSVVEGLSFVGQVSLPELQTERVKALGKFQNESVFRGAYGSRAEGQLDDIYHLLARDPQSRQAVVSLYDGHRDLGRWNDDSKSGDVPCTLTIQFRGRDVYDGPEGDLTHALDVWVSMRSNDAWMGLPYDMGQFIILQSAMAHALGWKMGRYWHTAGSLHLYESHWADAAKIDVDRPGIIAMTQMEWGTPPGRGLEGVARRARDILRGEKSLRGGMTSFEEELIDWLP